MGKSDTYTSDGGVCVFNVTLRSGWNLPVTGNWEGEGLGWMHIFLENQAERYILIR